MGKGKNDVFRGEVFVSVRKAVWQAAVGACYLMRRWRFLEILRGTNSGAMFGITD